MIIIHWEPIDYSVEGNFAELNERRAEVLWSERGQCKTGYVVFVYNTTTGKSSLGPYTERRRSDYMSHTEAYRLAERFLRLGEWEETDSDRKSYVVYTS